MHQPFDHSIDWRQPGPVLKVSGGRVLYTERHANGSITERDVFDWNQTWGGTWTCSEGRLTISVGSYTLQTDPQSNHAIETNRDDPRHSNIPFLVLPVLLPGEKQLLGTGNEALVKIIQGRRVFLSELGYDGVVREYPLVLDKDPEAWNGAWSHQGNTLSIKVGDYSWTGVIDERDGLVRGTETIGDQRYELNGVLVRVSSRENAARPPEERQAASAGSTLDQARLDQQFLDLARSTAEQMKQRGKQTQTWRSDSGEVVEGWEITYDSYPHKEEWSGTKIFDESWGHTCTILSVDGDLYRYEFSGYETNRPGEPQTQLNNRIWSLSASSFVGREGSPFSNWTEELKRLPYK